MTNKISAGTIARTLCLLLALANQMLVVAGHSVLPIDDETLTQVITTGATMVTALAAWWKNNSFTKAAIQADEVMKAAKAEG